MDCRAKHSTHGQHQCVVGKDVFSAEARQVLKKGSTGGAAGIIQAVSEATGEQLSNAELTPDKIREGMMIGMGYPVNTGGTQAGTRALTILSRHSVIQKPGK